MSVDEVPKNVITALGKIKPIEVYKARDLMLVFDNEETVKSISPDFTLLRSYPDAVCVTSQTTEENIDFISRFFCAYDETIPEDPVTGSAHCTLAPYWAEKLGKTTLNARQVSARGGDLKLELKGDRAYITGEATLYMKGEIYI